MVFVEDPFMKITDVHFGDEGGIDMFMYMSQIHDIWPGFVINASEVAGVVDYYPNIPLGFVPGILNEPEDSNQDSASEIGQSHMERIRENDWYRLEQTVAGHSWLSPLRPLSTQILLVNLTRFREEYGETQIEIFVDHMIEVDNSVFHSRVDYSFETFRNVNQLDFYIDPVLGLWPDESLYQRAELVDIFQGYTYQNHGNTGVNTRAHFWWHEPAHFATGRSRCVINLSTLEMDISYIKPYP